MEVEEEIAMATIAHSVPRINNVQNSDVCRLARTLRAKINELDKVLNVIKTAPGNKRCESYPRLLSESLEIRGKAKDKTVFNRKRKECNTNKGKMRYKNIIESHRKHIRNLSNEQLTDEQITLLSRGLKFIPTLLTTENNIRHELLKDFDLLARRMRLQYIYYCKEREPHPFHVISNWSPPVQPSVA